MTPQGLDSKLNLCKKSLGGLFQYPPELWGTGRSSNLIPVYNQIAPTIPEEIKEIIKLLKDLVRSTTSLEPWTLATISQLIDSEKKRSTYVIILDIKKVHESWNHVVHRWSKHKINIVPF